MTDAKLAPSHLAQTQVNWRRMVSVIALTSFTFLIIRICERQQIIALKTWLFQFSVVSHLTW
jgi:hypothetical protein